MTLLPAGFTEARQSCVAWEAYVNALTPGPLMDAALEHAVWVGGARSSGVPPYSTDMGEAIALALEDDNTVEIARDKDEGGYLTRATVTYGAYIGVGVVYAGRNVDVNQSRCTALCRAILMLYAPNQDELDAQRVIGDIRLMREMHALAVDGRDRS